MRRLEAVPGWQWKERASNRDEGLAILEQCISKGLAQRGSKAEVKAAWSKKLGIGSDQVHKYLRKLDAKARSDWDNLRDDRGRG